ncbi:MAG: hypothetical protein LQ341_003763 [Variospora aurantia]|nr:MAG: hypothetical protein LQ341_003763 [Variospora aurantia]
MSTLPNNSLSDIFSDSPPASPTSKQASEPSDIPRLRSTHATNGYRDGISVSKDQALQPGFDEAYPLGAILGLRVGYVLGVLEGLCGALRSQKPLTPSTEREGGGETEAVRREEAQQSQELLAQAKEELTIEKLFGEEYWGSDGMWAYDIDRKEEEDVTFWEVADQHPMVRKWLGRARDEALRAGIRNAEEGFVGIREAGTG